MLFFYFRIEFSKIAFFILFYNIKRTTSVVSSEWVGKIALFGKLWIEGWHVGLANVCNVGGVSFFFCGGKKKTK